MRFVNPYLAIILFFVTTPGLARPSKVLESIQATTGWKPLTSAESSTSFDAKTLSSLRPHDASLFLEYGFTALTSWRFEEQKRVVVVELYEMIDFPAAYGVFTSLRSSSGQAVRVGHAAAMGPAELIFQQDKYYVVLKATGSRPSPDSLLNLAMAISRALPSKLTMPLVAEKLPTEHRLEGSERFLMGPVSLSRLVSMDGQDSFGLGTGAEAAMARYKSAGESATLLLIQYPTQQLAKKFLDAGYAQYSKQYPDQPVFYKRDGPMVVLVLDSNSPELATTLLDQVSYVSMVSWDPKVEPPTIAQVMIRIFLFCGVMLALTLSAGLAFAIIRLLIKRLFPGKVFDRPEDMEVIRLNLDAKK